MYDTAGDAGVIAYSLGGQDVAVRYNATFDEDQWAQLTFDAVGSNSYLGPAVRCQGTATYYGYFADNATRYLFSSVGGSWTQVAVSGAYSPSVGDTMRLEVEGTTLRCYWNGSLDTSLTGGTGIFTDANISGGTPGICGYAYSVTRIADNWYGGELPYPL